MSRIAWYGDALYAAVFGAAALFASLLLLTSMSGLQSAQNTLIFACGVIFIVRAVFASRAAILRIRAGKGERQSARSWRPSDALFFTGDVVALGSLGLSAWILWSGEPRLSAPVVPFGFGLAAAYLFYLIAISLRFADK